MYRSKEALGPYSLSPLDMYACLNSIYIEWSNVILMLYFLLQDLMTLFWTRYKYGSCGIWTSRITYIWCMSVLENVYIMCEWHHWIHCMCKTLYMYAELGCVCVDKSVCDPCDVLQVFLQCGICVCELDRLDILKNMFDWLGNRWQ